MKNINIITVSKLTKKFKELTAVDGISFEVKKAEIFAFLGPNGAGKSTTIKILTTLLEPTSGELTVNGYDPCSQKEKVRKSFGIVFQDPSIDEDLTALENLKFHAVLYGIPKSQECERIESAMKLVGLWEKRKVITKTFSGGMKRRLEIARGLLHHPKILFLDEPTLGLDPQTRNSIWEYIKEVNKKEGMTVFFTTHYMDEAEKVSDRIAIIDHGKIVEVGSSAELKKKTNTDTLEDAFLELTGKTIREENSNHLDHMRNRRRMHGRGRR